MLAGLYPLQSQPLPFVSRAPASVSSTRPPPAAGDGQPDRRRRERPFPRTCCRPHPGRRDPARIPRRRTERTPSLARVCPQVTAAASSAWSVGVKAEPVPRRAHEQPHAPDRATWQRPRLARDLAPCDARAAHRRGRRAISMRLGNIGCGSSGLDERDSMRHPSALGARLEPRSWRDWRGRARRARVAVPATMATTAGPQRRRAAGLDAAAVDRVSEAQSAPHHRRRIGGPVALGGSKTPAGRVADAPSRHSSP